jgi:hypothetical protein
MAREQAEVSSASAQTASLPHAPRDKRDKTGEGFSQLGEEDIDLLHSLNLNGVLPGDMHLMQLALLCSFPMQAEWSMSWQAVEHANDWTGSLHMDDGLCLLFLQGS